MVVGMDVSWAEAELALRFSDLGFVLGFSSVELGMTAGEVNG
jgi:hypothetical protein